VGIRPKADTVPTNGHDRSAARRHQAAAPQLRHGPSGSKLTSNWIRIQLVDGELAPSAGPISQNH
jgi:hypothetical protein